MDYKTSTHQFLLFYKKEGSHQDAEQHKTHHDDHKKLAECMGFPHNKPFVYNGKADFCHKLSAPLSEECRPLVTALSLDDMSVIYGNWIMVWSVSEREIGKALLGMMATSHVEFKALHDNKAVEFILRNMFTGGHKSCITYYANMTKVPDDPEENSAKCVFFFFRQETNGVLQAYNETGVVDFYQTCPDCLLITYNILAERFLLSYRREGSHQDVKSIKPTMLNIKKVSECLGFPDRPPYIYNGKADFCHKKSAPEPSAE
ncbi:LOW QUALITY PROTEIN: saxitoxin and tetrodotoxin-binding protein 1-like [Kryptolebias marmoratus]|uniref:LOW QUALITY PROTEIN: saxitoxin and tetrodotoxin-binding protein 1-like n=1 Tax=Kryptolebias marmoratus TaxID=37003 RepID=UPI000D530BD5|nr:LOW QUALITY PROTEIN: saxitoxin and tetrodotoxin-binding protein 1-like [Kryptolebias marmoratus]